jgi:hypothetical protein
VNAVIRMLGVEKTVFLKRMNKWRTQTKKEIQP